MHPALLIGFGLAGLVVFAFGLKKLVEWISFPCQFCEAKVKSFRQISIEAQEAILRYFREYEGRKPDRHGLFVCLNCKTVHDDFSGEKQSRDIDSYGCVTFCKVCHATMRGCEPENNAIKCPRCDTPYKWQTHEKSGFRFLMPPKGARLHERSKNFLDSW